jgi:hypothetical protein
MNNKVDINKRAEVVATLFRENEHGDSRGFLLSELIETEFIDLNFEQALEVIPLAIEKIKKQTPRTIPEKIAAVEKREYEYKKTVYLESDLSMLKAFVKSSLSEVCKSEGVSLKEFLRYSNLNSDKRIGSEQ